MVKICIITQGCSTNIADSEIMAGLLKEGYFDITNKPENADLVIINSCTVKGPTETAFYKKLKEFGEMGKKIIVAGCIPQADGNIKKLMGYSLIGTYQINNIVDVVEETLNGNTVVLLAEEKNPRLNLPKIRKNPFIDIVPIASGCSGNCSYCKVKFARGDLFSYPIDSIITHIKSAIKEGVKEIWITSQDTGAYGQDIKTNLPALLREVTHIPRNFKIRLGMANPNHVLEHLDELIRVYKDDKMFKFLHCPVQSGNNTILKKMNRKYEVLDFKFIVRRFRDEIPDITLATDIICGFPGETKKHFEDSLKLIREIKPNVLNRSRFWARPGTKAAKFKQPSGALTKSRSRQLTTAFNRIALAKNKKWLNWTGEVLIDKKGKDNTWIGRNDFYRPVIIPSSENLLGERVRVKVIDVTIHYLRAQLV